MKTVSIKLVAVLIAAAGAFSSCNKIVTSKKLDGDWTVSSGTMTGSSTYSSGGFTVTSTSNGTYNGTTLTTTTTQGGYVTTETATMSVDYTFDKKTGEYSSVSETSDPEYTSNYYQVYDDAFGSFDQYIYVDRNTARVSTTTENGFFTITGDAGDELEKNSQVTFQMRSSEETYTDTYTYFLEGTQTPYSVSGKYYYDWNTGSYMPFTGTDSGTETVTGEDSYAMIWNVTEMSKDEMTVEYTDSYDYSDGSSSTNSSTQTTTWVLTQN